MTKIQELTIEETMDVIKFIIANPTMKFGDVISHFDGMLSSPLTATHIMKCMILIQRRNQNLNRGL